jgi:hypothetical protein
MDLENTGVISQEAAETDVNTESLDESTQFGEEEETPDIDFASFFEEEDGEGNAEEEGSDSPPNQTKTEGTQQETKPAERLLTQAEVDAIVQKRLKQQAASIEKRNAEKIAAEAELDKQVQKYIDEHPDMNLPPEMVKAFLRPQQPQAQEEPVSAEDEKAARVQAWQDSFETEEPMIQADMRDPSITVKGYADKDPVFKSVLIKGITPYMAHMITKDVRAVMQQEIAAAKAKGGQEVIAQIKQSNNRAVTPVSNVKATGRVKSVEQMIADTPVEKLREMLQNGAVYIGGK